MVNDQWSIVQSGYCRFALKGSCKFRSGFADSERAFSRYPFTKGIVASLSKARASFAPASPTAKEPFRDILLQRVFVEGIEDGGEVALAGIGEDGDDFLAFVLGTLGELTGSGHRGAGTDAYQ